MQDNDDSDKRDMNAGDQDKGSKTDAEWLESSPHPEGPAPIENEPFPPLPDMPLPDAEIDPLIAAAVIPPVLSQADAAALLPEALDPIDEFRGAESHPKMESDAQAADADFKAITDMISQEMHTQIGVPLTDLNTSISARMRRDDQLLSMQKELEKHRADLILKMMRPFVNALITAHDNMTMRRDSFEKTDDEYIEKTRVMKTLDGFLEDIELTLSENGIDRFSEDNCDEKFSGAHQKVVGYLPAQNEDQHGLVARIMRPGFSFDEQILQKQRVKVFKYSKPAADTASDENKD